MHFDEHKLKSYAETVSPNDLHEGEVYFAVNYIDDEMLVPVMEPKVFIGRNLVPEGGDQAYFQDIDSYRRGVRFATAKEDDEAVFETGTEHHLFSYEHALEELMRCAIRRRKLLGTSQSGSKVG